MQPQQPQAYQQMHEAILGACAGQVHLGQSTKTLKSEGRFEARKPLLSRTREENKDGGGARGNYQLIASGVPTSVGIYIRGGQKLRCFVVFHILLRVNAYVKCAPTTASERKQANFNFVVGSEAKYNTIQYNTSRAGGRTFVGHAIQTHMRHVETQ